MHRQSSAPSSSATTPVDHVGPRRQHDDAAGERGAQVPGDGKAILARDLQIDDDEVGRLRLEQRPERRPVGRHAHGVAFPGQIGLRRLAQDIAVVDHDDPVSLPAHGSQSCRIEPLDLAGSGFGHGFALGQLDWLCVNIR